MCQRTVIVFVLALVTIGSAAPQYSGDEFLEDKRLYLKGSDKKKAIWKSANDKTLWTWFQPAEIVNDPWPTQKPWADNYWQQRLKYAEERVQAATRIAARSRGLSDPDLTFIVAPQKTISQEFDFPVGSRSRRAKRDLMDVSASLPLNAIYKDNVIAEIEPYGSEDKKKDSMMKVEDKKTETTELPVIMEMMDMSNIKNNITNDTMINRTNEMAPETNTDVNMKAMNITNPETLQAEETTLSNTGTDASEIVTTEETSVTAVPVTAKPAPAIETKLSSSKGFQLCSEDGLSCSRPISIHKLQGSSKFEEKSSTEGMKVVSVPLTGILNLTQTSWPKTENLERIPLTSEENKSNVPVVVLKPVETVAPTEMSMTTVEPESNVTMVEQGRSFEASLGNEMNQIPFEVNQTKIIEQTLEPDISTTSTTPTSPTMSPSTAVTNFTDHTMASDTSSSSSTSTQSTLSTTLTPPNASSTEAASDNMTTPSTKSDKNETKDESVMDKVANWFENAWDSVKNWF